MTTVMEDDRSADRAEAGFLGNYLVYLVRFKDLV